MGFSTYFGHWSCSAPDSQYKVSKSIGFPQSDELKGMWPFYSSSWICLLIFSFSITEHRWIGSLGSVHLGSDWWIIWPNSAKAPLWGRWRCPRTPPQPFPSIFVVRRGSVWRSLPPSSYFPKGISRGKKFPSFGNELTTLFWSNQKDGGRRSYLWYHVQTISKSNNNNTRPWLIHRMSLP